jgi:prevent-host-death family protein
MQSTNRFLLARLDKENDFMRKWTLERAKNAFSEVVRLALAGKAQLIVRGGREDESVVVIARDEYDRLLAVPPLHEFLATSPLADAVAAGDFGDPDHAEFFPRDSTTPRDVELD